jgi:hypothetical protein
MTHADLGDALKTMPGAPEPKIINRMSKADRAATYDRLAAAPRSPEETLRQFREAIAIRPEGETPATSTEAPTDTTVVTGAAADSAPAQAPAETPLPTALVGERGQAIPDEPAAPPAPSTSLPESEGAPAPAPAPAPTQTAVAVSKGRKKKPVVVIPEKGSGSQAYVEAPTQGAREEARLANEQADREAAERADAVEKAQEQAADKVRDALGNVVSVVKLPKGDPRIISAVRELIEGVGNTDGSDHAVSAAIENWGRERKGKLPGDSDESWLNLADRVHHQVFGEPLPGRAGFAREARAESEAQVPKEHTPEGSVAERRGERVAEQEGLSARAADRVTEGAGKETRGEAADEANEGETIVAPEPTPEPAADVTPVVKTTSGKAQPTDSRRRATNILKRILSREITPEQGDREYGQPKAGVGNERRAGFENLATYIHNLISQLAHPDYARDIERRIAETQKDTTKSPNAKRAATLKLQRELSTGNPARIKELLDVMRRLQPPVHPDPVGHAADAAEAARTSKRADLEKKMGERTGKDAGKDEPEVQASLASDLERERLTPEYRDYLDKLKAAQKQHTHGMFVRSAIKYSTEQLAKPDLSKFLRDYHEKRLAEARAELQDMVDDGYDPNAPFPRDEYRQLGKQTRTIEEGFTSPGGIDPRSSRYYKLANDPRLSARLVAALRDAEANGRPFTLHEALRHITDDPLVQNEARPLKMLAQTLLRFVPDIPVYSGERSRVLGVMPSTMVDPYMRGNLFGYHAYYPNSDPTGAKQHIMLAHENESTAPVHSVVTLLHEAVHAATARYVNHLLANDPNHPHLQALEAIRQELQLAGYMSRNANVTEAERSQTHYATSNAHETITELMTNPHVQAGAATMRGSPGFRAKMTKLGFPPRGVRSVWEAFTGWVSKALGIGTARSASEYTMLDYVMRPLQEIVEHGAEFQKNAVLPKDPGLHAQAEPMYQASMLANSPRTRDLVARADPRGLRDRMQRALLNVKNRDAIVDQYKDVAPGLVAWRRADENIRAASAAFAQRHGDAAQDLLGRINKADDKTKLSNLMVDVGIHKVSLGGDATGAIDANKHLTTPEQQANLARLQDVYRSLSPKDKALYNDVRDFNNKGYAEEREAVVKSLVHGYMPDATPEQISAFTTGVKTKGSLEKFLADPDNSPIAKAFGDDWQKQRQIARTIANLHNMGFVQGDYFPLRRFGNYVVRYGDEKDLNNYGVEMFESYTKAQERRAELVKQGRDDVYQVARKDDTRLGDLANKPALVNEMADALRRKGASPEHIAHATEVLNDVLLRHATQSEAARARMSRRGVKGASTDQARVLAADFLSRQARIGYLEHGLERARAFNDIYNEAKAHEQPGAEPGAATRAMNVYHAVAKRMTSAGDHDNLAHKIASAATNFSFVQSLMSPSHMLTSTFETHTNSLSLMGARHGYGRTALALGRALAELSPAIKGGAVNTVKALGNRLKNSDWNMVHALRDEMNSKPGADKAGYNKLSDELIRTGIIDHTQLQDFRHAMSPAGDVGTGARKAWNIFYNTNAAMAHAVDVMNKMAVAKSAYDMEVRKNGGDKQAAVDYAIQTTRRVMPNYTTGNREAIARLPLMSPLLQFKRYGLHMYALMGNLARESFHGADKAAQWEARKAFAGILATHAMMAGVLTLIADPLRYIGGAWDAVTGKPKFHDYQNDVRGFLTDTFGLEAGEIIARGLPHAVGIDLHRRVGLANLLEIPEMDGFDKKGAAQVLLGLATGATGENLANMVDGVAKFHNGDIAGTLKAMLPRVVRDPVKAFDLADRGVTDSTGKTILAPDKLSTGDIAAQAAGFQPARVSEFREGRNAVLEARQEQQSEHTRLVNRWLAADPGERQNVMQEIRLFNQNPAHPKITMERLLRAQQQRRKDAARPGGFGLRLPAQGARALMQEGRFARAPMSLNTS